MIYLAGVVLPCLLQALIVWLIIEVNTGNGSWLGLAAWLFGMVCIPATALVNVIKIHAQPGAIWQPLLSCYVTAFSVPVIASVLLMIGAVVFG